MKEGFMVVDSSYFEEEEREGFLVTEAMKRYWAASLHTVEHFADICKKYDLKWWIDCGTMLGAVRHKGWIPWDDDIDIAMERNDYIRFLSIAKAELPSGYEVDTYENPWHRYSGFSVVNNHRGTLFSDEILQEYFWCPFPAGFDLYAYDGCPRDPMEQQRWRLEGMEYLLAMKLIREEGIMASRTKAALRQVGYRGKYGKADEAGLLAELGHKIDETGARYRMQNTKYLLRYSHFVHFDEEPRLLREWFNEIIEMPFEYMRLPVPRGAKDILACNYGDYMAPVQGASTHDYPIYTRHMEEMIRFLENGGIFLKDLPPELSYLKREADIRNIAYKR